MILIGSRAAKLWFPDFREPNDWDLIASYEEIMDWKNTNRAHITKFRRKHDTKFQAKMNTGDFLEFDVVQPDSSPMLLAEHLTAKLDIPGAVADVPEARYLYLNKRALVYWPVHWRKTIDDVHWLKSRVNSSLAEPYYEMLYKEYVAKFGKHRVNLAVPNEVFFAKSEGALQRQFDHDFLHEAVAYYNRPLYECFKRDLSKASLSQSLFEAANLLDQQRLVREETMAVALERYLIPGKMSDATAAYQRAYMRLCTTLTTGWFREFAIENWPSLKEPDKDFVLIFWKTVEDRDSTCQR